MDVSIVSLLMLIFVVANFFYIIGKDIGKNSKKTKK